MASYGAARCLFWFVFLSDFELLPTHYLSVVAVNELTNHKVAIKILNKRRIRMQGVFEKVKREIKVLRRFNHPHIIKHFEFIDTSSDIFIVLEYAEKGELFDLIQRKDKVRKSKDILK